jgi:hypothetical protein
MEKVTRSEVASAVTGEIITPRITQYVVRYQTFLNKTAEAILALTETVYEASTVLKADEFEQFKKEVGLTSAATVSKFVAIGRNVGRLKPYADQLPHSWTTLYSLAQLPQHRFDTVAPSLTTEMTAADVKRLLGFRNTKAKKEDRVDIKLYLFELSSLEKREFVRKLKELIRGYKVISRLSEEFGDEIKKFDGMESSNKNLEQKIEEPAIQKAA